MIILPMPINSKYAPDIPTICITIVYFILDLVCVGGTITLGYFAADSFIKNELSFGGLFIFLGLMMAVISIITVAITVDTIKDIKKERREKLAKLAWKQQAKKKQVYRYPAKSNLAKKLDEIEIDSSSSEEETRENYKNWARNQKERTISEYVSSLNFKK